MKSHNIIFTNKLELENFIHSHTIESCSNVLIQIFSGVTEPQEFMKIPQIIKKILPNSHIIGTTTSGEIYKGNMYDGSIIISFSLFENSTLRSRLYNFDNEFDVKEIENDLYTQDTKGLIVFSDGLKSNTELFIKELYEIREDVVIAGGRAGDNHKYQKTYVFNEENYVENGWVLASLSGENLFINSNYLLNWTSIGKEMTITKCDGNILYEMDSMPVIEVYRKYLGEDIVKNLPVSCILFPLIINKAGIDVARAPISTISDGGMAYAGHFEEGDVVRFSFADIEDLTDNLGEYFELFSQHPSEAVYIYSCAARRELLKDKLLDELNLLESLAPSVGFFTYGEFLQSNHIAEVLNVTTTFMMISESKKSEKKVFHEKKAECCDSVNKALTHLVKVTTQELEHLSTHDVLTGLYNRSQYLKVIHNKIKSAQRYGEDLGLIMIDIDHFKLVNDNYGHNLGDEVLKAFANVVQKNIREDDFVSRWGGEEFVIIANHADINALEQITKKLQKAIAKIQIGPITGISASFGLTVYIEGDTDEEMFKRIDNSLYVAKQDGRDRYVIG